MTRPVTRAVTGTEDGSEIRLLRRVLPRGPKSLLARILYSNLLVAGVAVVSLTALSLAGYRAEFERQETLRASMLAGFVARQSEVPALVADRAALEKIAAQAAMWEDVVFVQIRYGGGRDAPGGARGPGLAVLARGGAMVGAGEEREAPGSTAVEAAQDIRLASGGLLDWDDAGSKQPEILGRARVRISLGREEALFRLKIRQSIAVAGLLLALIVAIQLLRMRTLFRPLKELIAFTRRVGDGDLRERTRTDQMDEIADVAVAFNQMLDRLSVTTVSRDYVDNIIHSMAECLIVVGPDGTIRTVNEAALSLLGYAEYELNGQSGSMVMSEEVPVTTALGSSTEQIWRTRDGRKISVLFSSAALRRGQAGEEGTVWLAQDITERRRIRLELIAARERYALAVAGANDGIWDWNVITGEVYYSPRWKHMLGYEEGDLPGRLAAWLGLLHPDDRARVEREMEAHRIGVTSMFESEHRMRHYDGTYRWILNRGLAVRGPDGTATRIAGSQTDITQNKVSDPLTGLPNRVCFTEKLTCAFERRRRDPGYRFAVLFLDLDRFKIINDSMGHVAGDHLLVAIAGRLEDSLRKRNTSGERTIARLSGDEFAVLLEGIEEPDAAAAAAATGAGLIRDLAAPFLIGGREIFSSVSIGVAPAAGGYANPSEILRDAHTAMYRAKAAGKSRCEVFDHEMRAQAVGRLEIDTDLRKAVECNEFVVYYQPMFSIPDERLSGFEALIRWVHPKRGLILPNDFIPIAEETGLIVPLGAMVLREACLQMRQWQAMYRHHARAVISVNVSPREFLDPGWSQQVASILRETGLDARSLALEITETMLVGDAERAIATLTQLRELGVGL